MLRKLMVLIILAAVSAVAFTGCGKKASEKDVFYEIGDTKITRSDIDQLWLSLPEDMQYNYMDKKGRQDLLNSMVALELLYQDALKQKLDQNKDIQFRLERIKRNTLAEALVQNSIKKADLYLYYQETFIRLDGITLPFANDAEKAAAKSKADQAYAMLKQGTDFAKVKAAFDPSHTNSEIGYYSKDGLINDFGPDAPNAAFSLTKSKRYSGPVELVSSYYILYALELPGSLAPKGYDQVWDEIVTTKREEAFRGILNDAKSRITVKPHQQEIDDFLKLGDDWDKKQQEPQTGSTVTSMPMPQPGSTAMLPGELIKPGSTVKPTPGATVK
jgi:hypothetical protein